MDAFGQSGASRTASQASCHRRMRLHRIDGQAKQVLQASAGQQARDSKRRASVKQGCRTMWGNKKETADAEPVAEVMIPPVARPAAAPITAATATSVAAGCVVNGSITATGNVVVDGKVTGDVRCAALTIGRDGEITGNVVAETATVRGKVAGDVRARTIQLAGSGVINGDLTHAVLIIEEGGAFEGRSKRLADPLAEVPVLEAPAAASDAAAPAKKSRKDAAAADAPAAPVDAAPSSSALANELGDGFAARNA